MTSFTSKDVDCAWTLAKLEDVRRSMDKTLLTGKPYRPAASHLAPAKPHLAVIVSIKRGKK